MGLAARWAEPHRVHIRSRTYEKVKAACQRIGSLLARDPETSSPLPHEDYDALKEAEIVVI